MKVSDLTKREKERKEHVAEVSGTDAGTGRRAAGSSSAEANLSPASALLHGWTDGLVLPPYK